MAVDDATWRAAAGVCREEAVFDIMVNKRGYERRSSIRFELTQFSFVSQPKCLGPLQHPGKFDVEHGLGGFLEDSTECAVARTVMSQKFSKVVFRPSCQAMRKNRPKEALYAQAVDGDDGLVAVSVQPQIFLVKHDLHAVHR